MIEQLGFLTEIGYLVAEGQSFQATTTSADPEIAELTGPQFVVPVDNARYALNAANARWESLVSVIIGTQHCFPMNLRKVSSNLILFWEIVCCLRGSTTPYMQCGIVVCIGVLPFRESPGATRRERSPVGITASPIG